MSSLILLSYVSVQCTPLPQPWFTQLVTQRRSFDFEFTATSCYWHQWHFLLGASLKGTSPERERYSLFKGKWSRSVVSDSLQPVDCSPPSSSIHGILQARILEWVAISFRGSSWPRDRTQVSHIAGRRFNLKDIEIIVFHFCNGSSEAPFQIWCWSTESI